MGFFYYFQWVFIDSFHFKIMKLRLNKYLKLILKKKDKKERPMFMSNSGAFSRVRSLCHSSPLVEVKPLRPWAVAMRVTTWDARSRLPSGLEPDRGRGKGTSPTSVDHL